MAEAKERFSELVRRAELNEEATIVSTRDETLAAIETPEAEGAKAPERQDWLYALVGLCADAPEVTDAIDEAFRSRSKDMPRPLEFPWEKQ